MEGSSLKSCTKLPRKFLPGVHYTNLISDLKRNSAFQCNGNKMFNSYNSNEINVGDKVKVGYSTDLCAGYSSKPEIKSNCLEQLLSFDDKLAKNLACDIMKMCNLAQFLVDISSKTYFKLEDIKEDAVVKMMGKIAKEYLELLNKEIEKVITAPRRIEHFESIRSGNFQIEEYINCEINCSNAYNTDLNESEFVTVRERLPSSSTPIKHCNEHPVQSNFDGKLILSLSQFEQNEKFATAHSDLKCPTKLSLNQLTSVISSEVNTRAPFVEIPSTSRLIERCQIPSCGVIESESSRLSLKENLRLCDPMQFQLNMNGHKHELIEFPQKLQPENPQFLSQKVSCSGEEIHYNGPSRLGNYSNCYGNPLYGSVFEHRDSNHCEVLNINSRDQFYNYNSDWKKYSVNPSFSVIRDSIYNSSKSNNFSLSIQSSSESNVPSSCSYNFEDKDNDPICSNGNFKLQSLSSSVSVFSEDSLNETTELSSVLKISSNSTDEETEVSNNKKLCKYLEHNADASILCAKFIETARNHSTDKDDHITIPLCYEILRISKSRLRLCKSALPCAVNNELDVKVSKLSPKIKSLCLLDADEAYFSNAESESIVGTLSLLRSRDEDSCLFPKVPDCKLNDLETDSRIDCLNDSVELDDLSSLNFHENDLHYDELNNEKLNSIEASHTSGRAQNSKTGLTFIHSCTANLINKIGEFDILSSNVKDTCLCLPILYMDLILKLLKSERNSSRRVCYRCSKINDLSRCASSLNRCLQNRVACHCSKLENKFISKYSHSPHPVCNLNYLKYRHKLLDSCKCNGKKYFKNTFENSETNNLLHRNLCKIDRFERSLNFCGSLSKKSKVAEFPKVYVPKISNSSISLTFNGQKEMNDHARDSEAMKVSECSESVTSKISQTKATLCFQHLNSEKSCQTSKYSKFNFAKKSYNYSSEVTKKVKGLSSMSFEVNSENFSLKCCRNDKCNQISSGGNVKRLIAIFEAQSIC